MKHLYLFFILMLAFLNMNAKAQLGKIEVKNISSFEIQESILEQSNTAKIVIPRSMYNREKTNPILGEIKVGDPVKIYAGYNLEELKEDNLEFSGYIREIESDYPLVIHCEDAYILRQSNHVKSYRSADLNQVLKDILPEGMKYECPQVSLGKFQIDNASTFVVLQELMTRYGLYSRLQGNFLQVGLAYDFGSLVKKTHTYHLSYPPDCTSFINPIAKNQLVYKRKEDFKIRFNAVATDAKGKKVKVTVGNKELDASERSLNFAGSFTEKELKAKAENVMAKLIFDGYTGSVTGFGEPYTHAGDKLCLKDHNEPSREGTYLIERVGITFNDSEGYKRTNTLAYKIPDNLQV